MRKPSSVALAVLGAAALFAATRTPDIPFSIRMIDPGFSETAAVADFNNDGKLDVVSAEFWYEAPKWTKHRIREINFNGNYIDNFSDIPVDVDGDGWVDLVQVSYFAKNIVWLKNPGKSGGTWAQTVIDNSGSNEFALLADMVNSGKPHDILPQFAAANVPAAWFEISGGKVIKHVVSQKSYGHGIGWGDVNGDHRNDILVAGGWLEAPADPRARGDWTFHPAAWGDPIPAAAMPNVNAGMAPPAVPRPMEYGFMHVIDINGDGRPDMITQAAHDYGVFWFEQRADGSFVRHLIDNTWSQGHASTLVDLNGSGKMALVTGKRYMAHNGTDPGEREPLGIYWYEFLSAPQGPVVWTRHIIDYGGRMGAGMQICVQDMDGDGDLDLVTAGKSGIFLAENLTRPAK